MAKTKKRPDGRVEIVRTVKGVRKHFYGKTLAEAERKYAEALAEIDQGKLFKTVAEEWLAEAEGRLTYYTLEGYKAPFKRAVAEFGERRLFAITSKEIKAWISSLARMGYAKKTVRNHLNLVSGIFRLAQEQYGIDGNPALLVRMPSDLPQEPRELPSDEDDARMMESLSREKFAMFLLIAKYAGARKGEILGLRFGDFDREAKTIRIERAVCYINGKASIKLPKTKAGIRTVPLLEVVERYLPNGKPDRYLFGGIEPWSKSKFEHELRVYREQTGVEASPHQWRHLYATILFDADISAKDAQKLLGHANFSTTMDIYTHVRDQRIAKATDKLNSFVKKSSSGENSA